VLKLPAPYIEKTISKLTKTTHLKHTLL